MPISFYTIHELLFARFVNSSWRCCFLFQMQNKVFELPQHWSIEAWRLSKLKELQRIKHNNFVSFTPLSIRRANMISFFMERHWANFMLDRLKHSNFFSKNGPFPASFCFIFFFLSVNKWRRYSKIRPVWIRTAGLWSWKQTLYQMSHHHCQLSSQLMCP